MNEVSWLLDTNILLRVAEAGAAGHADACRTLDALLRRGAEPVITPQNLIEFWAVATRPRSANGLGWSVDQTQAEIAALLARFQLLADTPRVFECWLDLMRETSVSGKRTHDARLAAVARAHGVPRLLTFNVADFASFRGVQAVHPADVLRAADLAAE